MKKQAKVMMVVAVVLLCGNYRTRGEEPPRFRELFNGKDLSGWVNVNTAEDTWSVRDGLLVCKGKPIGVMRSDREYENFILQIEWRHMEAGGNSGTFVWSNAKPAEGKRLPNGVEVQMLELQYSVIHNRTEDYVHGELFGVGGVQTVPDNPRGRRSKSVEKRCKGKGQWNQYTVVCVDGVIKLSVNGKFVNGVSKSTKKKGYICLESEGAEIHFRNIRIMELPPGVTKAENAAPVVEDKESKPAAAVAAEKSVESSASRLPGNAGASG